jgi:6-phosphogluconolactonase (cycloisomerase 2 family)
MRNSKHTLGRGALAAVVLGGIGAISSLGATAALAGSPQPVGHVYVDDNAAGSNTVSVFSRSADGSLTPLATSPFSIGGNGTGAGTGSQGAVQETPDEKYLLAVDPGSNQISVLKIAADGALRAVAGGPVSSGGIDPVSIAVDPIEGTVGDKDLVYVANAGTGGSNYTGFTLSGSGVLQPLRGTTVGLPNGSDPGDVLFNSNGTHLAGTRAGTALIDSFVVEANGHLKAAAGSPFTAQGPGPIGSEFRPTDPNQLFVSNAHGGTGNGTVSAFTVSSNGTLTSLKAGPFADDQTAPCWVEISHDGRFLFAVNTATPSISRYAIASDGALRLIGSTPLATPSESGPVDARLSPDGTTLSVVDSGGDSVSTFAVHGGNLTALGSPAPLPAGSSPVGIVVN